MRGHLESVGKGTRASAIDDDVDGFVRGYARYRSHMQALGMVEAGGIDEEVISSRFTSADVGFAGWLCSGFACELDSVTSVMPVPCFE